LLKYVENVVFELFTVEALEFAFLGGRLINILVAVLGAVLYLCQSWNHFVYWLAALLHLLPALRLVGHLIAGLLWLTDLHEN
jgi:hypothetical protein